MAKFYLTVFMVLATVALSGFVSATVMDPIDDIMTS